MDDLASIRRPAQYERILARARALQFGMNSDVLTGSLLRTLSAAKPRAAVLELGTGCGLGTCWILDGLDAGSSLVSVDTDARVQSIAALELGSDARLSLVLGDGGEFLETCGPRFDLIYADAFPGKYTHLQDALDALTPGGVYVVDDMLPQPNWPSGHEDKVAALIDTLDGLSGYEVTKLAWSTGVILVTRRPIA
jgi:predicted O-methyltransferase YrrM